LLLLGADGMLGRAWQQVLEAAGVGYHAPCRETLDLARPNTVSDALTGDITTVINCAAWTDVDGAEPREAEATQINGHGVGQLAKRCAAIDATLIHYSTDYVFNGQANEPYQPDQPRDPINAYGRSKAEGERQIETSGADYLIIRTSWLYGPWGKNFATTMHRLMTEKEALRVVNDQRGRPTNCQHLAGASWQLFQQQGRGIWHVTDGGACTWFEFASAIRDHLLAACRIEPCTSDEFPRPAKRPGYSVLDLSATEARLGKMPHWRDNVKAALDRMEVAV
jgi:dTDP-4-dehydrorhamnose reductase